LLEWEKEKKTDQKSWSHPQGGDDALEAQWFSLDQLEQLPFQQGKVVCEALACLWDMGPYQSFLSAYPAHQSFSLKKKGSLPLYLYPGSFQPWHQGHDYVVKTLLKRKGQLVIIPDSNPWKETTEDCAWDKYKQLSQRLSSYLKKPTCFLYPGLLAYESSQKTFSWIHTFQRNMLLPGVRSKKKHFAPLWLVIGDDCLFMLDQWTEVQKLLQVIDGLFVIKRVGSVAKIQQTFKKLKKMAPHLRLDMEKNNPHSLVSSTKIRKEKDY
jgi:nicotinic acid mononucleotide adenylyltransferase